MIHDVHEHKCRSCGKKWKHDAADNTERRWSAPWDEKRFQMHTCPKCGNLEWMRVDGSWEP